MENIIVNPITTEEIIVNPIEVESTETERIEFGNIITFEDVTTTFEEVGTVASDYARDFVSYANESSVFEGALIGLVSGLLVGIKYIRRRKKNK